MKKGNTFTTDDVYRVLLKIDGELLQILQELKKPVETKQKTMEDCRQAMIDSFCKTMDELNARERVLPHVMCETKSFELLINLYREIMSGENGYELKTILK